MTRRSVYGITMESDFSFRWPLPHAVDPREAPDLRFVCTRSAPIAVDWDEHPSFHSAYAGMPYDGPHDFSYHRVGDVEVVRVRATADHYLWHDRIVCHLPDPNEAYLAEIQLLGMVLAQWLERRGVPTLHASAVCMDGMGVAFMGVKGGGKTTLATASVMAGHALLVDDLLALELTPEGVLGQPGYPMLRLWPEQVEAFFGDPEALPRVHPAYDKRRVELTTGQFQGHPVPLRRIYLPQRLADGPVQIERIRSSAALIELVRESFLREATHPLGLAPSRLAALAAVLEHLDVRVLRYPSGFERLEEVLGAVRDDLRS